MKRGFAYLFLLIPFCNAIAQISITQSHLPKSNDTFRYSNASLIVSDLKLSQNGASQIWDYSKLTPVSQDIYSYKSAYLTPYAFYFLGFNQIGLKTLDTMGVSTFSFTDIYTFYTKSSSVFKAEGIGYKVLGVPLASYYIDDDEIYNLPLDYGDSNNNNFKFKFSVPGSQLNFSYIQSGKRTTVVKGYGSVKTPYKTYANCLKVVSYIDQVDSIVTQFSSIPVPSKRTEYKWLSAEERIPVLEIIETETSIGSKITTLIRFRDSYRSIKSPFAPIASFALNKAKGMANYDTFYLIDQSLNNPSSWEWDFPKGTVEYVNGTNKFSQNPYIKLASSGFSDLKLTVSNAFGSDDTLSLNAFEISKNVRVNIPKSKSPILIPNPSNNIVSLHHFDNDLERILCYSADGKKWPITIFKEDEIWRIELSSLAEGFYIIHCEGKRRYSMPLLIQR